MSDIKNLRLKCFERPLTQTIAWQSLSHRVPERVFPTALFFFTLETKKM